MLHLDLSVLDRNGRLPREVVTMLGILHGMHVACAVMHNSALNPGPAASDAVLCACNAAQRVRNVLRDHGHAFEAAILDDEARARDAYLVECAA